MWKKHKYKVKYAVYPCIGRPERQKREKSKNKKRRKKLKTRNEVKNTALRTVAAILLLSRGVLCSIYDVPTVHTKRIVKPVGFALQLFVFQ